MSMIYRIATLCLLVTAGATHPIFLSDEGPPASITDPTWRAHIAAQLNAVVETELNERERRMVR